MVWMCSHDIVKACRSLCTSCMMRMAQGRAFVMINNFFQSDHGLGRTYVYTYFAA